MSNPIKRGGGPVKPSPRPADPDTRDAPHGRVFGSSAGVIPVGQAVQLHGAGPAAAKYASTAALGASVVLLPIVANTAVRDLRQAARDRSAQSANRAVGSSAYTVSLASGATRSLLQKSAKRAASKAAAELSPAPPAKIASRLVRGLTVTGAVADAVWASSVLRDPEASGAKKVAAGVSATASAVAASATLLPGVNLSIGGPASMVATGALLLSNFL